jgi:hypothetical protein
MRLPPPWQKPGGNIMNKLAKIARHSTMWTLGLCGALTGSVIVVYGVPLALGVVLDILQLGATV